MGSSCFEQTLLDRFRRSSRDGDGAISHPKLASTSPLTTGHTTSSGRMTSLAGTRRPPSRRDADSLVDGITTNDSSDSPLRQRECLRAAGTNSRRDRRHRKPTKWPCVRYWSTGFRATSVDADRQQRVW